MGGFENVSLWYARSCSNGRIVTITNANKEEDYICPICGGKVVPKAKESKCTTMHFAHIDSSKCSNEAICHFWFKNKYLQVGDKISITTGGKKTYVVEAIEIEKRHIKNGVIYQPDVTVTTTNGEVIYFEFKNKNAKREEEYLQKWEAFGNTVVEVDIKRIINDIEAEKSNLSFRAKFYKGKLVKVDYSKRRKDFDKYIKAFVQPSMNIEDKRYFDKVSKLEWFWEDALNYISGVISFNDLLVSMNEIDEEYTDIIGLIFSRRNCLNIAGRLKNDIKEYILNSKQAKELRVNNISLKVNTYIAHNGRRVEGLCVHYADKCGYILFDYINTLMATLDDNCEKMKKAHISKYVIKDFYKKEETREFIDNLTLGNYTFKLNSESIHMYYYDKYVRRLDITEYVLSNNLFCLGKNSIIDFINLEIGNVVKNDYNETFIEVINKLNKLLSDFYFLSNTEVVSRFKIGYRIEDELNLHINLTVETGYGQRDLFSSVYSNNVFDKTLYTSNNIHKLNKHISEILIHFIEKQDMKRVYMKPKDVLCKQLRRVKYETR